MSIYTQTIKNESKKNKKAILDTISKGASIANDSIKPKKPKEAINFIVTHDAMGSSIQNMRTKQLTLTDKAHILHDEIDLKAGEIVIDYDKEIVFAKGVFEKDSVTNKNVYKQRPIFKQGSEESEQDSIRFNYKTRKAIVYGVNTKQGEMNVYGEKTKRVNDSTIYIRNIRFTTSSKKKPDYYIATNKAKLVPGKKIIVGASQMVIADVPTPLVLPFAYFPLEKKRTSGFLIPSWGENGQGFFLQNGGYYFVVNDYMDIEATGDIYSNSSWSLNTASNYYVRYKYSGNLGFRYQNQINSLRGFDNYSKQTSYNITWSHRQDSKNSPNSNFSASVDLGSSKFYRESVNEIDAKDYLKNTMNSSISFSKKFVGTPFNMNVALGHSQNSNTEAIDMTLPSLSVNMDRQYPFVGKGGVKKNAFHKIGVQYSMAGKYQIKTNDTDFLTKKMWTGSKKGIQHKLNASTNVKLLKYFTLQPRLRYNDIWYFDRIEKKYNQNLQNKNGTIGGIVNDTVNGFKRFNSYSGGVAMSTTRYGMFKINGKKLKAIRHTLRPSISWNYTPNVGEKYIKKIQKSSNPNTYTDYNDFDGGIYGTPNTSESNSIGLSLNNSFEAKVKPKEGDEETEEGEFKKVNLLNNLSFSTGYNIVAEEFKWSNGSISTGTTLFKNRFNINASGSIDPYKVLSDGKKVEEFNLWLRSATITANFSISSKDFSKNKEKDKKNVDPNNTDDTYQSNNNKKTNDFAHNINSSNKKEKKLTKLYNASIPWNISFNYMLGYTNNGYNKKGIGDNTLGFNGDVEFSPKWKVGFRSAYDIKDKDFGYTMLNFSRDLDSFRFNFSWVPFGDRTSYNFFIGIKSSMLSDLKWDKVKPPDRKLY